MKSLISKKGYGIYLETLSSEEKAAIQKQLTVKPVVLADYDCGKDDSFPVYRISDTRIYIPRFYGTETYGSTTVKIKDGVDANLVFNGSLKEHQVEFCNKILKELEKNDSCIANSTTGSGKCLDPDTPVITISGVTKKAKHIAVGDLLIGPDSKPRAVLSVCEGIEEMFEITPTDKATYGGESYTVNMSHILSLININTYNVVHISVDFYMMQSAEFKKAHKGYRTFVDFDVRSVSGSMAKDKREAYVASYIDLYGEYIEKDGAYRLNALIDNDTKFIFRSVGLRITDTGYVRSKIQLSAAATDAAGLSNISHLFDFTIKSKGTGKYNGFELDGDGRFLLGDFTVTHNTTMALWLASQLKKRTMIIVHKNFLKDQWIERIKQFLPTASIGIICQDRCEPDCDIIIAMIQSVNSREYPPGTFDKHHFNIFDEAHHMAAQGFSQAFFKLGTKKTLALSATPKRADGLSKVLDWFLGNTLINTVVSKIEVPTIKYIRCDYSTKIVPKFNFKHTLNSADMINQLVRDPRRNEQIVEEVVRLHQTGRKILVLSGRRGHCEMLAVAINNYSIKTGLYLGGMKNNDLTESNKAKVILATYSMASEAYDNPELDTLVMATGMGNVQQSVGRILRQSNQNKPLVVDFTDVEFFGSQARRRKEFYKKHKYLFEGEIKINMTCDSDAEVNGSDSDAGVDGSDSDKEGACLF